MKTLFLMRHAKSSWDNPDLVDFDRPLNKRGLKTAPFMGELMRKRKMNPDLILSSPAKRAAHTAKLVKEYGKLSAEIVYEERIYEATAHTLLIILSQLDNSIKAPLLVGHNPGLEALLKILTGQVLSIPTAALAKIALEIDDWQEISESRGRLEFLIRPREEMN